MISERIDHRVGIGSAQTTLCTYLIGYTLRMEASSSVEPHPARLLLQTRQAAGLSQAAVASRAGTSRTAVSAYEHGAKSPSLDTVVRLLAAMGFELDVRRPAELGLVAGSRGREIATVSPLPRLPVEQALAVVELPLSLNWSEPGRRFDLADRSDRARVYEMVLREGESIDLLTYVDGALLIDLWNDLVLPRDVRAAWAPIIGPLLAGRGTNSAIA
jgi:transcriptional regulator with XRE-family HTH domain